MGDKIVFINTGHRSMDDRVFYHQAKSLLNKGYNIEIISTKENLIKYIDGIKINSYDDKSLNKKQKISQIVKYLTESQPQIILADTPLAVIASSIYKKNKKTKIVYDITEWYPSKKNLIDNKGIIKFFKVISLSILNIFAGFKSDFFIFGEHFKSIPFRFLFFWKPYIYLPYFPDLDYIVPFPIESIDKNVHLTYSGIFNEEKGIVSVIKSIADAAKKRNEKTFYLKLIGDFHTNIDQKLYNQLISDLPQNMIIQQENFKPFSDFCKTIGNTHIFLDLRKKDIENNYCLPIKLFYYLACGRPIIYSNLNSIKKTIPEMNVGFLCEPADIESISNSLIEYIDNSELYVSHCENALSISKLKFNWKLIENDFLEFILMVNK
ncbi:MAG: glycosyltransferase family 4 protein [Paludibacter sp.]|nr:glycosyltransferase family 4 protein [Paludibacter sp.]